MIGEIPIITFDTRAHNRLVEDGPLSEPIYAALQSGLFFRFAALSLEELQACPDPTTRAALFASCGRLQHGQMDCIYPHNELITRLVKYHHENPATFDWKTVDVRGREYEQAIRTREFIGDEALAADQWRAQKDAQKAYRQMFANLRPELEKVFEAHGEVPPATLGEAIARLQSGEGRLIWGMGKLLYDRAAETDASEATIKQFMDVCPPFRALIYAMLMSWYDLGVRDPHIGEKFKAGRNDLFMSVYLPYCDMFVTDEKYREQEKCLREVVALAGLETRVLSYDDFCNSFLVTV